MMIFLLNQNDLKTHVMPLLVLCSSKIIRKHEMWCYKKNDKEKMSLNVIFMFFDGQNCLLSTNLMAINEG